MRVLAASETSPRRPAPGRPRTGSPTPPGTPRQRSALSGLAEALDERWTQVGAALAEGAVNVPQARVIAEALDALPGALDAEMGVKAEAYLVTEAGHFGPQE